MRLISHVSLISCFDARFAKKTEKKFKTNIFPPKKTWKNRKEQNGGKIEFQFGKTRVNGVFAE
jgi:hypothetical protein